MSKFGWSYPPGCSGPPEPKESPLQEAVLAVLDDAGVSEDVCGEIIKLIHKWEVAKEAEPMEHPYEAPPDDYFDDR